VYKKKALDTVWTVTVGREMGTRIFMFLGVGLRRYQGLNSGPCFCFAHLNYAPSLRIFTVFGSAGD
jgi:hypothetical protein